jgi:integrase
MVAKKPPQKPNRRAPKEGSLVARGPGVWDIRATVSGQRRQLRGTVRGGKAEALLALRKLQEKAESEAGVIADSRLTVERLCGLWLEFAKPRVRSRTFMAYAAHCRLYIIPKFGNRRARDLSPHHVDAALACWRAGKRNDKESKALSSRSVLHVFCTLRTLYRWAVRRQLVPSDPTQRIDPPRIQKREMQTLTPESIGQLLVAAQGTDLLAPLAIAVATGLRRGELLGLRWRDLDLGASRLTVRRALEVVREELSGDDGRVGYRYTTREKPPKTTGSRRTLILAPSVVEILSRVRHQQRNSRIGEGIGRDPNAYVFANPDGTALDPGKFSSAFAKLVKRAKLPHVRLHDLRHSYATLSLQAGIDLKTISASLGHADIATTANLYAHVTETLQAHHAERVEHVMGGALAAAVNGPGALDFTHSKSNVSQKPPLGMKAAYKYKHSVVAPTGIEPVFPP